MESKLIEFLKKRDVRISNGDKWMCVRENHVGDTVYTVYYRGYGMRKTRELYEGLYLDTALNYLNEEETR